MDHIKNFTICSYYRENYVKLILNNKTDITEKSC